MKLLILLFFILTFPLFIFLTTVLYSSDITPLLKTDLAQHHIYSQLSSQLGKLDSGDNDSAVISQFIQNKFTPDYVQHKVNSALDSSDAWIRGKSKTPPVVSFKDVKDELNTQYPQLLPSIENAAAEMKKQEAQNPAAVQQNPQAAKNIDMLASLAKSDFTIHLNTYLAGLKNFYTTIRILQPILAILLLGCLILLGYLNKSWHSRFKWIGITLLLGSILGFALTYGNIEIVKFISKFAAHSSNHFIQMSSPVVLQIIKQYVEAYVNYQNTASIGLMLISGGCFISAAVTRNMTAAVVTPKRISKKS